jgi:dTDP-4-dehydrorhamnose reductase
MVKVLVIGADGQLGKCLSSICERLDGMVLFTSRKDLDITDRDSIKNNIENFQPTHIVNCAAYTAVDKAEEEEKLAFDINEKGVKNIILESESLQSKIIHISTDYVFDGDAKSPYKETDKINPQSVYGRSKAAGEAQLATLASDRSIIIRTSWLYSEFGHNFLKTMLRLGAERDSLNVVDDQKGIPTYAKDLAAAIIKLINLNPSLGKQPLLLHFSNSGESNWFEFAREIMHLSHKECEIMPIPTSSFPTAAKRPAYSVLDCSKFEDLLAYRFRPWQAAVKECIDTINKP